MAELQKLVRTYRVTAGLSERLRLAEQIFRLVEPDLRLFVFSAVVPNAADDVLQEVLKSVATSLATFKGNTDKEFWAWCYRIARNRLTDHFRKKASDRSEAIPTEELWGMVEASAQDAPINIGDRLDLEYAMNLLVALKPECRDLLWNHYVLGLDYGEIAEEENVSYDNARMRVSRCLDAARTLVA